MLNYWFIIYHIQRIIVGQDILKITQEQKSHLVGTKKRQGNFKNL